MDANELQSLRQQFRDLGERFRRIAGRAQDGHTELIVACAWGGKLLMRASKTQLIPTEVPQLSVSGQPEKFDKESRDLISLWVGVIQAFSITLPQRFPSNPGHFDFAIGGNAQRGSGIADQRYWRIRAENYAIACDAVADGAFSEKANEQPISEGPWSEPDSPTRWAKRFSMSPDTFKRRIKEGKIRHKKLSPKSYQIHIGDLPSGQKSAEVRTTQH